MTIITDPQTKRKMEASKKVLGEEAGRNNYRYLDISTSPFTPGRADIIAYILSDNYSNWRHLVNLNLVRDPFELMEIAYKSLTFETKVIKVYIPGTSEAVINQKSHPYDKTKLF